MYGGKRISGGWFIGDGGFGGRAVGEGDGEGGTFGWEDMEGDVRATTCLEGEGGEGKVDLVVGAELGAVGEFYVLTGGEESVVEGRNVKCM